MSNDREIMRLRREDLEDFDKYWGEYAPDAVKREDRPALLSGGLPGNRCGYDDLIQASSPDRRPLGAPAPTDEGGIVDFPTSYDATGEPQTHMSDIQRSVESQTIQPDVVCASPMNGIQNALPYTILALLCLLCGLVVAAVRAEKKSPNKGAISKSGGGVDRTSPAVAQAPPANPQSEAHTRESEQTGISETVADEAHSLRKLSVFPVRHPRQFIPPPGLVPHADSREERDIGPPPIDIPLDLPKPSKIEVLEDVGNVPAAEDESVSAGTHRGKLKSIFSGLSRVFSGRKQKVPPNTKQ